ncbi:MAG TPA: circadian clock KaiB family protein [Thermoanaerobaculia bacterium]|jgi:circadian clock protein KaiB|nr:circadian clock KaiB family protein [Thermoanaerobaculia bacterium]
MPGEAQPLTKPAAEEPVRYSLRLFVTGATPVCSRAVASIRMFCDKFLKGRYSLEVIDVYQQPALADEQRILATPTLVRVSPLPFRRFVGNLSDPERLSAALGLAPQP